MQLLAERDDLRLLLKGTKPMNRRIHACLLVIALTAIAAHAVAQSTRETRSSRPDAYGYTFSDDPLQAGLFGPNDARCVVRPHGMRSTLIRPRTAFVIEMLKSVESL
jgi:hypothetical protein